jgi:hypothetical protein
MPARLPLVVVRVLFLAAACVATEIPGHKTTYEIVEASTVPEHASMRVEPGDQVTVHATGIVKQTVGAAEPVGELTSAMCLAEQDVLEHERRGSAALRVQSWRRRRDCRLGSRLSWDGDRRGAQTRYPIRRRVRGCRYVDDASCQRSTGREFRLTTLLHRLPFLGHPRERRLALRNRSARHREGRLNRRKGGRQHVR